MTTVKSRSGWLNANLLQAVNTWEAETETAGQSPRLGKNRLFAPVLKGHPAVSVERHLRNCSGAQQAGPRH